MKYLVLGASAAGINCAKTIRSLDKEGEITVVSKDDKVYSRCMLHHVVSGSRTIENLNFVSEDFFEKLDIHWMKGKNAKKLHIEDKKVVLDDESILSYDKLLIATGASSFIPPIKNLREGNQVVGFRDAEDVEMILQEYSHVKDIVVLGGGLVGIDVVSGLMAKKVNISLVEFADRILPLQLDKRSATTYEDLFKDNGVHIHTGVKAEEVLLDESNNVKGLKISSGEVIPCEMIIVATGVRPNLSFISENTVNIDKGIVVDEYCATNIADVFAAGDVCGTHPIWPLAVKQGITAGHNMVGKEKKLEDHFGFRNSLNFMDLQTVSIGIIEPVDDTYEEHIEEDGIEYKKIIVKDGIIQGAILQGDISYCGVITTLIKNKVDISKVNKNVFDINYADFFSVAEDGSYEYVV
ncbi:NAD(P)/FAD-dependent oxidoreductase [Alkalibaculum sp. M08DMB]|uniref:NAD(P)/FAD-dependent oxidoreductase n=1 Tax=Alkalibaculum sporogenes TaxID=2655001 RepID=A0A6A7K8R5_9FIRM|nr:FAD-dependent oxidoreductase [Alkalibaculum sporogenes]MPW25858.1 NAD(P)/FAD-dependent oxidoreductase [Alkalibaculum sporogenes]